jgi:hypothetical protein
MNGRRQKLKCKELNWVNPRVRRWYNWGPRIGKWIRRRLNKRERQEWKRKEYTRVD